jgi:predicted RNA-binding Zn-ribbon protein involved in translation (DUF1610 family)
MGIFEIFNTKANAPPQSSETKDERKAECPNCQTALSKIPGSKTKCPNCGKFMFVRTRPKDNARIVVTKEESDKIDEDWSIISGTHDSFIKEEEDFAKEKEILRNRFGKEPSENDVKWGLLNKQLIETARNGDWGLYRNTKFEMGETLRKEMRLKGALQFYLEVCYLDLNGPSNTGGVRDRDILKEFPPFDPNEKFPLAPGVIELIEKVSSKLGFDLDMVAKLFIEHNSRIYSSMKLPLSPDEGWELLSKELSIQ